MTGTTATQDHWTRDLVLALRLRRVRGDAIGDAVEVVAEHCRETGETPQAAFGSAEAYAAELADALPPRALVPGTPTLATVAIGVGTALGTALLLEGVTALAGSDPAAVRWSVVVSVLLTGAAAATVVRFPEPFLTRTWPLAVLFAGLVLAALGLSVLLGDAGIGLPPWLALVVGTVAIAGVVGVLVRTRVLAPDPVLGPVVDRAG